MEAVALREFTLNGVTYKAGDLVKLEPYNEVKIGQLYNQRLIRPQPLESPVAKQRTGEKER